MDPTIGLLGIIAALISTIAILLPRVVRNAAAKEASVAYERTSEALRGELVDTERRCDERILRYKTDVDVLTGRVAVLEHDFADRIAEKVAERLKA